MLTKSTKCELILKIDIFILQAGATTGCCTDDGSSTEAGATTGCCTHDGSSTVPDDLIQETSTSSGSSDDRMLD